MGRGSRREEDRAFYRKKEEEKGALAISLGTGTGKKQHLRRVQQKRKKRSGGNPVWTFEWKDELAVCHRHECLRVPAGSTSQLGLSLLTRPPPDQRL